MRLGMAWGLMMMSGVMPCGDQPPAPPPHRRHQAAAAALVFMSARILTAGSLLGREGAIASGRGGSERSSVPKQA